MSADEHRAGAVLKEDEDESKRGDDIVEGGDGDDNNKSAVDKAARRLNCIACDKLSLTLS